MCGAISLAATAALRSGAGLVTVATFDHCADLVAALQPCYMTLPLISDATQQLTGEAQRQIADFACDSLACGPGFGRSPDVAKLVTWIYRTCRQTVVVDADAIAALAASDIDLATHAGPRILTPHPGEFRRLAKDPDLDLPSCRKRARQIARQAGIVLLVKGHRTLVTDGQQDFENPTGNPGMATGGTGDVLTGVITALVGQQMEPFAAAQLGTYLHGRAGDLAADELGQISLIASDVVDYLPRAFREMDNGR